MDEMIEVTVWLCPELFPKPWTAAIDDCNISSTGGCLYSVIDSIGYKMKESGFSVGTKYFAEYDGKRFERIVY